MSKFNTTLLITGINSGNKVKRAVKWGIPIISDQWVWKVAETGKFVPFEEYALKVELSKEESEENPSSTAAAAASTRRLRAATTHDLSTMSDQASFFGMSGGNANQGGKNENPVTDVASGLGAKPFQDRGSVHSSRRLGLVPTDTDLSPVKQTSAILAPTSTTGPGTTSEHDDDKALKKFKSGGESGSSHGQPLRTEQGLSSAETAPNVSGQGTRARDGDDDAAAAARDPGRKSTTPPAQPAVPDSPVITVPAPALTAEIETKATTPVPPTRNRPQVCIAFHF